jgi:hypothetical protein
LIQVANKALADTLDWVENLEWQDAGKGLHFPALLVIFLDASNEKLLLKVKGVSLWKVKYLDNPIMVREKVLASRCVGRSKKKLRRSLPAAPPVVI